jgi:hypothetical protein
MERLTLKQFEEQWKALLTQKLTMNQVKVSVDGESADDDPFDCSSVAIPPTRALVEHQVAQFVDEWRELDERKISTKTDNNPYHKKVACAENGTPRWYANRVRLPPNFDYATQQSQPPPPPPPDEGEDDGYRVLSLKDPTKTTSYHQELWNLFARIPTADQVETEAIRNSNLPRMERICKELHQQQQQRLRINDRHEAPPAASPGGPSSATTATIRFECWKGQTKQGSLPEYVCVFSLFVSHSMIIHALIYVSHY